MKSTTLNKIYFLIIVVLLAILWFKSCKHEPQLQKLEIPEKTATLPTATDTVIVYKTIYDTKTIIKEVEDKDMSALVDLVENKMKYYRKLSDSISKENEYLKAIEPRGFKTSFNDDFLSLELNGVVSGEIHEITPTYTIKQQKISVPIKKKNKYFYGGQIGQTKEFNSAVFEVNLGLQNKKDNIILIGYDTDNMFKVGYLHKF